MHNFKQMIQEPKKKSFGASKSCLKGGPEELKALGPCAAEIQCRTELNSARKPDKTKICSLWIYPEVNSFLQHYANLCSL